MLALPSLGACAQLLPDDECAAGERGCGCLEGQRCIGGSLLCEQGTCVLADGASTQEGSPDAGTDAAQDGRTTDAVDDAGASHDGATPAAAGDGAQDAGRDADDLGDDGAMADAADDGSTDDATAADAAGGECNQHADCGPCMKCSEGTCVEQDAGEDLKSECTESPCRTGACDGAGACGWAEQGASCGTCHRCDVNGVCQPSTTHEDCGTCEMCEEGACVDQPAGSALKDDCPVLDCTEVIAGWNGLGRCDRYTFTNNEVLNGKCGGTGACYPHTSICSTNTDEVVLCDKECARACVAGEPVTSYNELAEVCHVDWQQHDCRDGEVCGAEGTCVEACNFGDPSCDQNLGCCSTQSFGELCQTSEATCYCSHDCD